MENHSSLVASAEINLNKELPLHLLCEAGNRYICDSTLYTEAIWLMLLSSLETHVLEWGIGSVRLKILLCQGVNFVDDSFFYSAGDD